MFRPALLANEGLRPLTGIHSSLFITNYGRVYRRDASQKNIYFQVDEKSKDGKSCLVTFSPYSAKVESHRILDLMEEFWPECLQDVLNNYLTLKKIA